MQVDFIPFVNQIEFPEAIEFLFHVIVSIILTMILYFIFAHNKWNNGQICMYGTTINILIGIFIYPITLFSDRTPHFISIDAITFWLVGHLLYGLVLSVFFVVVKRFGFIQ